jgi:hypothetical protein
MADFLKSTPEIIQLFFSVIPRDTGGPYFQLSVLIVQLMEQQILNLIFGHTNMKRLTRYLIITLIIIICSSALSNGQQGKPIQTGESVVLFSDRGIYITGEKILFSAFVNSLNEQNISELSRVLYCEIVTPGGVKVTGNKFIIENKFSSGYLTIPNDIMTGIYYLRSYTKIMRNDGPSCYNYTRLKIINPDKSEVQSQTINSNLSDLLEVTDNLKVLENSFLISTDKPQYTPRDTVNLLLQGSGNDLSSWKMLTLSVVPESSVLEDKVEVMKNVQSQNQADFFSETRGLSISGELLDNKTGSPLPHTRVNLSIIGRGKDFMAVQTDLSGHFYFSLPDYTGYRDLFLCSENTGTADPKLLIDNDFCTIPFQVQSDAFSLTSQERDAAYKMAVNVQLDSIFNSDTITRIAGDKYDEQVFYGKPTEILYIDNYIQLPTLEDYFNELPTQVKIRKSQGKKYFKILGAQTELTGYDPLTLVDLVAVGDPNLILTIPPSNISRIEVVNELYVKGDQTYGGIINIITKLSDFGGIDLPSSGIFINFGFLADNNNPLKISTLPNLPDTRNTLYWQPNLILDKTNTSKVSFPVSDTPGRYKIILNGVKPDGETYLQSFTFEVVKKPLSLLK